MADDMLPVDVRDPLLIEFAHQHDLRERFMHALQEIQSWRHRDDMELADGYVAEIMDLVDEALSTESIAAWEAKGRPLPWLDAKIGQESAKMTNAVVRTLSAQGDYLASKEPIE